MEGRDSWAILVAQLVFAACVGAAVASQAHGPADFKVFWAAHHTATPYNAAAIAQILGGGIRPFSYPPTFLLLTAPLRFLQETAAYVGWVALSAVAVVASLKKPAGPLVLFTPAVFLAGVIGQTSLFMGALLFAGATAVRRPIVAGVLFGVAACIKPQAVVLIPIVLIGGRHWRGLIAMGLTGLALSLAATAAYGPHIWLDWYSSLGPLLHATDAAWKGRYLCLPGAWRLIPIVAGAAMAWRLGSDPERAVGVAVAAALLGSLYAMDYDAAILAPFALSAALAGGWTALPYVATLLLPPSPWQVGLFAMVRAATPPRRCGGGASVPAPLSNRN